MQYYQTCSITGFMGPEAAVDQLRPQPTGKHPVEYNNGFSDLLGQPYAHNWEISLEPTLSRPASSPAGTWPNNNVIMTSKRCHNVILTS